MNIRARIAKLEKQTRPISQRVIFLRDGMYSECGQVISEAEYRAIASDPANDVLLLRIVRASEVMDK